MVSIPNLASLSWSMCGRRLTMNSAFGKLGNKGWNWDMFNRYSKKAERSAERAVFTVMHLM